jgi:hypothetical protein
MRASAQRELHHNAHPLMSDSDAQPPISVPASTEAAPQPAQQPEAAAPTVPAKRSGLDLSDLKIMPAWVSDFGKSPETHARQYDDHDRPQRGDQRRPGGGGQDRGRGRSFGPGGPGSAPRGDRPPSRRPDGGGDRNGPRPPRGEGGFRGRDSRHHDGPPQREWVDLPKDVNVSVHPEDKSLDALSAHIRSTGHAFSLFDVSRLVLAGGERFGVRFLCDDKRPQPLFRTPSDGGLFLSRDEALQHVLRGPALETFYRVEEIELEEPKGNFPSVAICGFSGELLGPASHHSFQTNIIRLHRERFGNMSLEDYKRRIRTDNSPETVQKWKDQQRKATRWIPVSSEPQEAPPAPAAPIEPTEPVESEEASEPAAPPPPSLPSNALASRQEVEAHFKKNHGAQAVIESRDVTVPGNIDKNKLSPALFIILRQSVEAARKHLFEMSQRLSAGFDRRGLKTFKRRSGKMFVCRVRPKAIDRSTVFAFRVTSIVEALKEAPGGLQLNDLLNNLSPAPTPAPEVTSEGAAATESPSVTTPALTDDQLGYLKDIRWLANEGYVIEYSDGLVTLGVQGETPALPKLPIPKAKPAATAATEETVEPSSAEPEATVESEAPTEDLPSSEPTSPTEPLEEAPTIEPIEPLEPPTPEAPLPEPEVIAPTPEPPVLEPEVVAPSPEATLPEPEPEATPPTEESPSSPSVQ